MWKEGLRRIFCPSSLNRIMVMALCIRAASSLSRSEKLPSSSLAIFTWKRLMSHLR